MTQATQTEAQRLEIFLKARRTHLGWCRESCFDGEKQAWDDYEKAWMLLESLDASEQVHMRELRAYRTTVENLHKKLDALLAHCPDGECYICSKIICPEGCELHFHHDGCPAC